MRGKLIPLIAIALIALAYALATTLGESRFFGGQSMEESLQPDDPTSGIEAHRNHLDGQRSPYLLQHADNPVDWYPWGEEAFAKAKEEDKPIFLSIGYSTCHWCHVMERESFEDPEVAGLLNESFVCIKVDREERPDIDQVYMSVCQMMTGRAGWPLTIIMTPDKRPFFAATYVPRQDRLGRIGLMSLIPKVRELWRARRAEVEQSALQLARALQRQEAASSPVRWDEGQSEEVFVHLSRRFDPLYGGFGSAPKFPTPQNLLFLLRYGKKKGQERALAMVEATLQRIYRGGIFDHVGGGFHRYSTDERWLVPHFEKMLYDQAMMAMAYTEAFLATGKAAYRRVAVKVLDYVLRDMRSRRGGFYSAEDADSQGEEGAYYLWTWAELEEILTPSELELAREALGVTREGNFGAGKNILHLTLPFPDTPGQRWQAMSGENEREKEVEAVLSKLRGARLARVRPFRDDKILTDWNGLMIAALAKAARAFERDDYLEAATRAEDFLAAEMGEGEARLYHSWHRGKAGIDGNLDDYSYLLWGLVELYQADFDPRRLERALAMADFMLEHFWDRERGGFFFTADYSERVLMRRREAVDGALPSGNGVAAAVLIQLAHLTGRLDLEERARDLIEAFAGKARQHPAALVTLVSAYDLALGPMAEVVLVAGRDGGSEMLSALNGRFLPEVVVLLKAPDLPDPAGVAPFTAPMVASAGRTTAYLCRDFSCELPTTSADELISSLP